MPDPDTTRLVPVPSADAAEAPIPRAPRGLKARGREVWRELHRTYVFDECPEKLILAEEAARTADVVARLQKLVDESADLRVRGSQGQPVAAPEVAELRQYRALLASLMKALSLPDEESDGLTRSQLGKIGARARWGA